MARVYDEVIEIHLLDHPKVTAMLEDIRLEVEELRQERDFWENEYQELLMAVGGEDPRHA